MSLWRVALCRASFLGVGKSSRAEFLLEFVIADKKVTNTEYPRAYLLFDLAEKRDLPDRRSSEGSRRWRPKCPPGHGRQFRRWSSRSFRNCLRIRGRCDYVLAPASPLHQTGAILCNPRLPCTDQLPGTGRYQFMHGAVPISFPFARTQALGVLHATFTPSLARRSRKAAHSRTLAENSSGNFITAASMVSREVRGL